MTEDDDRVARVLARLASALAEDVVRRYRIDVDAAQRLILDEWAKDEPLRQQAAKDDDPARLARTRAYKQAADRAKTKIYYHLRRYRQDDAGLHDAAARLRALAAAGATASDPGAVAIRDAVVAAHVSTRERLEELQAFWAALFELVPAPSSILDLGCGVMPLLYPFDGAGRATTRYLALDRDAVAVEIVDAWAPLLGGARLHAQPWSLADGFRGIAGPEAGGGFALALALKLVPVVARQEREHLAILAQAPAPRLLVTGAKQAMVKRRAIDRREERVLRSFAADHGLAIVGTLDTQSELGLLLARP
jgi:hypothetical protein